MLRGNAVVCSWSKTIQTPTRTKDEPRLEYPSGLQETLTLLFSGPMLLADAVMQVFHWSWPSGLKAVGN